MITSHIDTENKVIEVTISGSITRDELAETLAKIEGPVQKGLFDKVPLNYLINDLSLSFGFE